jgi:hypothetical protein
MALAIHFDGMLRKGVVADQSELAQICNVTQPRMTQIMNLLRLAPDIQEDILHLPPVQTGRDTLHEQALRPICAEMRWDVQRRKWLSMRVLRSPLSEPS